MIDSKDGGKSSFFDLYAERNSRIREGVQKLGLTMFPKSGYESPTVNCIKSPAGIDGLEVYERMRMDGFELAEGYGTIKNSTFRIGNMGYIQFEDIDSMLEALAGVLAGLGWSV